MANERPVANAGYVITGSGGGGGNGQYVFASLDELNDVINDWKMLRQGIYDDGRMLKQAIEGDLAPANDEMSRRQADALVESINKAIDHNGAMFDYAEAYIHKLEAALKQYKADDEAAARRMDQVDEA